MNGRRSYERAHWSGFGVVELVTSGRGTAEASAIYDGGRLRIGGRWRRRAVGATPRNHEDRQRRERSAHLFAVARLAPPHGDRNSLKIFRQITVLMLRQCADLDARIAALEAELAELRHRRREHRDATWVARERGGDRRGRT